MVKENIIIPKENYKQVEEVSYLEEKELITVEEQAKVVDKLVKNEIPSYEEFMKTYQEDEEVSDSYYYEIDSHGDIRIVKCYGPGFWDDFLKPVGKEIGSTLGALAIVSTGPVVGTALSSASIAAGQAQKKAAEKVDNLPEPVKEALNFYGDNQVNAGKRALAILALGQVKIDEN